MIQAKTFAPEDRGKPLWIIYANCQAAAIAALLPRIDVLAEQVRVKYIFIHSLEDPGKGWNTYPADFFDGVTCVWEQISNAFPNVREEFNRRLPDGVRRVRFPAVTGGMIWPFSGPDPRSPGGKLYLYGDTAAARLGIELGATQISDGEIFKRYMDLSLKRMPDLNRLYDLELRNWRQRDSASDVKVGDYLDARFRDTQLFYERARITQPILSYLTHMLLKETMGPEMHSRTEILAAATNLLQYHLGMDTFSQPIHPYVAEKFGLKWYQPEARYRWFMHDLTFEEWVVRCVRLSPYISTHF
jgi:hypothetical protein